MSTIITRELSIDYANCETYMTADGGAKVKITPSSLIQKPNVAYGVSTNTSASTGYASLNSTAMQELYPNEYAIPQMADLGFYTAYRYNGSTGEENRLWFNVNGAEYAKLILTTEPSDYTQTEITDITTTRDNTKIQCHFNKNIDSTSYISGVAVCGNVYVKLYFKQLICAASASTSGIASVSVSNTTPYVGESITYTASLVNDDVIFYGWFADMNGTQLVSQDLVYTCSPTEDMVLYALSSSTYPPTTNHNTSEGNIAYLTDNNIETYWRTSSEQQIGTYVQYMFFQPIFFIGIQTYSTTYPEESITNGTALQITTDNGVTWETVGYFTGSPDCTIAGIHKDNVNGVRLYVEKASNTKFCVNELILYYTIEKPVCNVIKAVYKKVDGVWTAWTDMLTLFEHGNTFTS